MQRGRAQMISASRWKSLAALALCGALALTSLSGFAAAEPARAASGAPLSLSGSIIENPAAPPHGGAGAAGMRTYGAVAYTIAGRLAGYSNEPGAFKIINLEPGSYRIRVYISDSTGRWASTWYGNTPYEREATVVQISDAPVTGLDVVVDYAGSISGRIGPSEMASGGVTATAYLYDPIGRFYDYVASVPADSSGTYRLTGLAAGSYAIKFSQTTNLPAFADRYYGDSTDAAGGILVTVEADATTTNIDGTLPDWTTSVDRVAGADRFETAAEVSRTGFDAGVPVVYVANGLNWPDALSAGPAAAYLGGPLLLVAPDRLPDVVATELTRLRPQRVVLVGGTSSVSDSVLALLSSFAPSVVRIGGQDRYETSRLLIRDAFGPRIESRVMFVVTGRNFPDALSAGFSAGISKAPVLLVDGLQSGIDQPTREFLWETIFESMVIVGGPAAVSEGIAADLTRFTKWDMASRIGGVDRYDTNRMVNIRYSWSSWYSSFSGSAFLASGTGFADALAAVPLAVRRSAPIFLTPAQCVPAESRDEMHHLHARNITVLGGIQALSPSVERLTPC